MEDDDPLIIHVDDAVAKQVVKASTTMSFI